MGVTDTGSSSGARGWVSWVGWVWTVGSVGETVAGTVSAAGAVSVGSVSGGRVDARVASVAAGGSSASSVQAVVWTVSAGRVSMVSGTGGSSARTGRDSEEPVRISTRQRQKNRFTKIPPVLSFLPDLAEIQSVLILLLAKSLVKREMSDLAKSLKNLSNSRLRGRETLGGFSWARRDGGWEKRGGSHSKQIANSYIIYRYFAIFIEKVHKFYTGNLANPFMESDECLCYNKLGYPKRNLSSG